MLRVTVDLIPFGDESKSETIGTMLIANDGKGDEETGNYKGVAIGCSLDKFIIDVKDFDRSKGAWALLYKALSDGLFNTENKRNKLTLLLELKLDEEYKRGSNR